MSDGKNELGVLDGVTSNESMKICRGELGEERFQEDTKRGEERFQRAREIGE
jgi:hypothetical protein